MNTTRVSRAYLDALVRDSKEAWERERAACPADPNSVLGQVIRDSMQEALKGRYARRKDVR